MKIEGKEYCDVSKVRVAPIAKITAKDMIVNYHYTHLWSTCTYAFGIFYMGEERDYLGNNEKLIGCATYGVPIGAQAATSICDGLSANNVLELTRLFVHDGYGSNIESYTLGQTFKWFKENDTEIKLLISYADSGQEHLGKIYQATNWRYEGCTSKNYEISLNGPEGPFIHSRSAAHKWDSVSLENLKREIGKDGYKEFWRRKSSYKHRYVQILGNKREKRDLLKRMKQKEYPYPSSAIKQDDVIEHYLTHIDNNKGNKFWN